MSTVDIQIAGQYYSCAVAGEMLDLTEATVRTYCNTGKIAGEKVGRDWLIPKAEIGRYKRERKDRGRPPSH